LPGGANNAETFWQLLCEEKELVAEVPAGRWPNADLFHPDPRRPGTIYTRRGAFLEKIELFDAEFFGISPREASRVDPQQRLLLEIAWEALEDAGLAQDRLAGTMTGVFVGIYSDDYWDLQQQDRFSINAYTNPGGSLSIAANRVSHAFDFRGPSLAVDTACSSALVAVHLACQSLWNGESTLALAGGVHLMLRPETSIGFCKASMLSPTGRCWTFDARADGYVRGEGAGLVVLKPLTRAVADGDPIYAVIAATGVNQDGHTPGISVPSAAAQEALLRDVCRNAGVPPTQIHYVEAHGTGTPVGDPIECQALGNVFGAGRPPGSYLRVGSVKTNLGHLEAAAGVAGLIKIALAVQRRRIPASLHFQKPNPKIDFEALRLQVQNRTEPWPTEGEALGGVASFGFGGTNAHVIVKSYDPPPKTNDEGQSTKDQGQTTKNGDRSLPPCPSPLLLPLSARSRPALNALAKAYRILLGGPPVSLRDLCYTAGVRRTHHDHRAALVGKSPEQFIEQLDAFLGEERRPGIAIGYRPAGKRPRVAFLFSGNGPQWWGMARQLLEGELLFRQTVEECDRALARLAGWSLLDELRADEAASRMERTDIAQPALFAVQLGLVALWRSWGVEPDAVAGHSVGEVAAACTAGILSFEDAVRVIYDRSRTQEMTAGKGRMAAVGLAAREVERLLAGREGVAIAAVNAPNSVTLTGDSEPLEEVVRSLEQKGIFCRRLRLNYAFHSRHMDPVREDLLTSLAGISPRTAKVSFLSTVTGTAVEGLECGPLYWWQNIRLPVLFAPAMDRLLQDGFEIFLEIGAHPVLAGYVTECAAGSESHAEHGAARAERGRPVAVVPSLRRQEDDRTMLLGALGSLYASGYPLDWGKLYAQGGQAVSLPSYPWQRERHWNEPENRSLLKDGPVHPLLGQRVLVPQPHWQVELDRRIIGYLDDHGLHGATVFPATGYIEMALAAAAQLPGESTGVLEDLELKEALVVPEGQVPRVQMLVAPDLSFAISSRVRDGEWKTHATGQLSRTRGVRREEPAALADIRSRCQSEVSHAEHYRRAEARGLHYGPSFQGVAHIGAGNGEALGRITVPEMVQKELQEYLSHPALLDACVQVVLAALPRGEAGSEHLAYLPVRINRIRIHERLNGQLFTHARLGKRGAGYASADCSVFDEAGNVVATIEGMRLQAVDLGASARRSPGDCLYEFRWQPQPLAGAAPGIRSAAGLPGPRTLAEALRPQAAALAAELGIGRYYEVLEPEMYAFGLACTVAAFRKLGWAMNTGDVVTPAPLMERLGVLPRHERLVHRLLQMLETARVLERREDEWGVGTCPEVGDPADWWRRLFAQFPVFSAELMLLGQCAQHLAEVLRGVVDPLELIFPEKSGTAENLYDNAPTSRLYNSLLGRAVADLVANLPDRRTLGIIEIGAGTGGTTSHLLAHLPAERVSYTFTDMSNVFLSRAEQRFRSYPFMDYRLLDIEQDPTGQGFDAHSFDLVIAANVLHATQDVRQTLANVKKLLASDGVLALLEISRTSRWLDWVFGLLKGWWLFRDSERSSHPLLTAEQWLALLGDVGFTEPARVSDLPAGKEPVQSILLARGPSLVADQAPTPSTLTPIPATERKKWILFADRTGLGEALQQHLAARGQHVVVVSPAVTFASGGSDRYAVDPRAPADMHRLLRTLTSDGVPVTGVVHCWSLDAIPDAQTNLTSLEEAQDLGCLSVIHLVQALIESPASGTPRLWLVTSGAQAEAQQTPVHGIAQAPLWGLGRTLMSEHRHLRCKLVDVSPPVTGNGQPYSPREIHNFIEELFSDDPEEEVLLRDDLRCVNRLVPAGLPTPVVPLHALGDNETYRLEVARPGDLETLALARVAKKGPGPGEVAIEVYAAGLNFKDLMQATGLLSGEVLETGFTGGLSLGLECAGRVIAIGPGVDEFRLGDEVVAMGRHCFSPFVVTSAAAVARKPAGLSHEEAATIPAVFLTAWYALCHLGRIRRGERVLVHAGAGGVGLAAIQIVQRAGGEAFATAGTQEKRDLLRALGVRHVMDSRTLAFADDIMEATRGEGVDVVLNSLGGEALSRSLTVLKRFGRFLEIGKRDLVQNTKLGLGPFEHCLSFHSIDLDQLLGHDPGLVHSLFAEVVEAVDRGELRPLPHRVFPIRQVADAFRCMQQSRHIGKIVISLKERDIPVQDRGRRFVHFRGDGSYLITGGLGGVGLALARWMVANGARHLVLAGRRGIETPEVQAAVDGLRTVGTEVVVAPMDVADAAQVARVLADIQRLLPPLRGVFHGALVLDDAIVLQQNRERLWKAMAPKVKGAWNLHRLTLDLPLDHFVLFSSVVAMLGNAGQANYAAGSTFLDALAHYRRGQGLPGLAVNWGALAEAGYVARHAEVGQRLARRGVHSMPLADALAALGRLLNGDRAQVGIMQVDWQKWNGNAGPLPRKLSELVVRAEHDVHAGDGQANGSVDGIAAMLPAERRQLVQSRLCDHVARVLGTAGARVEMDKAITSQGLDSLMAVDLRIRIERDLGVDVPVMKLMQGVSVADLAAQITERMNAR
jgi:acyl transferase domain-containing protein/NADPH:quinone reductase-like Zn-dependent oxidoreductase/SAM-dependent methyltransferase/acyl carrier protein